MQYKSENAFTLLELLVACSIFGMLVAIAVPVNSDLRESYSKNMAFNMLVNDIAKAQSITIARGNRGVITTSNSGNSYTFGLDVFPYNPNFTAETTEFTRNLPNSVTLHLDENIIFNPRGLVINTSELLVSRNLSLEYENSQFKSLTLFPTGVVE